ncbi:MAG TPA: SDR family NAD(P)-dependent oxidoreductase [Steroidobacteraceae bacterium]|nr:SDR family NAD(P)-dependent oxidoreductase [Steroidobacteraceae bacterium]
MRSVIVTGASRGLGLGIAAQLASSGFRVIAIARGETEALRAATAAALQAGRGAIHFRSFDLGEAHAIPSLVTGLHEEHGPLYGLVNNAGIGTTGVLALMPDADIERLLRINLHAPLVLSKYVVRRMMSERAGRIVNISSIVAWTGYSALAPYAATKAGLIGFTRALAREVGALGITVNAVAPGFVDTAMTHELGEEQREKIIRRSALRRLTDSDDVAAAVDYLMSERARNVTGTTLTVDAGNTA